MQLKELGIGIEHPQGYGGREAFHTTQPRSAYSPLAFLLTSTTARALSPPQTTMPFLLRKLYIYSQKNINLYTLNPLSTDIILSEIMLTVWL
jgi:hypothetical protein